MSDRNDNDGAMSRRGFLRGDFLTGNQEETASEEAEAAEENESVCAEDRQPAPETRGPAVDLDAILERAENVAGVSGRSDETPHPFYQNAESGDPE